MYSLLIAETVLRSSFDDIDTSNVRPNDRRVRTVEQSTLFVCNVRTIRIFDVQVLQTGLDSGSLACPDVVFNASLVVVSTVDNVACLVSKERASR